MSKDIIEQRKKLLEDFKEFRQGDISPGAEAIHKAFKDKDFVDKIGSIIVSKPVNKNPLFERPISEMRLYYVDKNYFESIDELLIYCRINKISTEELNILDYYRSLAGRTDVIRKSNSKSLALYTAVDGDGYDLYNNERSIYLGNFVWEYNHGSIRELYKPFEEKGIIFDNDVYGKIDETNQHTLKYCKEGRKN